MRESEKKNENDESLSGIQLDLEDLGNTSYKLRQLNFSHIYDNIEEDRYAIRSPSFVEKRAAEKPHSNDNGTESKAPPKKKLRKDRSANRGDKVSNNNFNQTLKAPILLTYEQVFHPKNRGKNPDPTHSDGTIICNNFHHHGYCWEKDVSIRRVTGKSCQMQKRKNVESNQQTWLQNTTQKIK